MFKIPSFRASSQSTFRPLAENSEVRKYANAENFVQLAATEKADRSLAIWKFKGIIKGNERPRNLDKLQNLNLDLCLQLMDEDKRPLNQMAFLALAHAQRTRHIVASDRLGAHLDKVYGFPEGSTDWIATARALKKSPAADCLGFTGPQDRARNTAAHITLDTPIRLEDARSESTLNALRSKCKGNRDYRKNVALVIFTFGNDQIPALVRVGKKDSVATLHLLVPDKASPEAKAEVEKLMASQATNGLLNFAKAHSVESTNLDVGTLTGLAASAIVDEINECEHREGLPNSKDSFAKFAYRVVDRLNGPTADFTEQENNEARQIRNDLQSIDTIALTAPETLHRYRVLNTP